MKTLLLALILSGIANGAIQIALQRSHQVMPRNGPSLLYKEDQEKLNAKNAQLLKRASSPRDPAAPVVDMSGQNKENNDVIQYNEPNKNVTTTTLSIAQAMPTTTESSTVSDSCTCPAVLDPSERTTLRLNALKQQVEKLEKCGENRRYKMSERYQNKLLELTERSNEIQQEFTQTRLEDKTAQLERMELITRLARVEEKIQNFQELQTGKPRQIIDNNLPSGIEDQFKTAFNDLWADVEKLMDDVADLQLSSTPQKKQSEEETAERFSNISRYFMSEIKKLDIISEQIDNITEKMQNMGYQERFSPFGKNIRQPKPQDCHDLAQQGHVMSGVYEIWPQASRRSLDVYCRMRDGTGWTVVQRRLDGLTSFKRGWKDYEHGFGSLYGDFWLGNNLLNILTTQRRSQLQIHMLNWEGENTIANYESFRVAGSDDRYRLHLDGYTGGPHDKNPLEYHNKMQFSTFDVDNDRTYKNCAVRYNSGWWFNNCFTINLNGIFQNTAPYAGTYNYDYTLQEGTGTGQYSLKAVSMEIAPAVNNIVP